MEIAAHPHICTITHLAAELVSEQSSRTDVSLLLFVRLSYEESYWAVTTLHSSIGTVHTGSCWEHCLLSEMPQRVLPRMRSDCGPGGSFPIRDQEPPRPIPNGPPGVPRDGNPSSWKEHDNSWRSPFKGDLALLHPGLQNPHWLMPGFSHPSCQTHTSCKHTHTYATLASVEVYMAWLMTLCFQDSLSVNNNPLCVLCRLAIWQPAHQEPACR